jgi:hypothetical protein
MATKPPTAPAKAATAATITLKQLAPELAEATKLATK